MQLLILILVAIISYVLGVFGFSQIVGSLQNIRSRGVGLTIFTVCLWCAILVIAAILVHRFFYPQRIGYYIVTVISLVQVLAYGKIS